MPKAMGNVRELKGTKRSIGILDPRAGRVFRRFDRARFKPTT
jgi:hypothetical protein